MATIYQDEHDTDRLRALKPYLVEESSMQLSTIHSNININFYQAYGPDFSNKSAAHVSIDPVWMYRNLLKNLQQISGLRFENVQNSIKLPPTGKEIVCTIRHDVDGDLVAAKQQAEIENEFNISTSYYLLHTAPYHGCFENGIFLRNNAALQDYLQIQNLDHEIALHTDGMTLYQSYQIDGAVAVREELEWLRKNGLKISGTTAHNSFSVYGCNNYSIFVNRPLAMSTPSGPKGVIHNGNWAPLQVLDEAELKLEYEANDLFWQNQVPLLYGCLMSQNHWYIAENQYGLLAKSSEKIIPQIRWRYGTHDDLIDAIADLEGPAYVKLVVHPMHYGFRAADDQEPWYSQSSTSSKIADSHVWAGGGESDGIAGCAITHPNEFNTPDRGLDCYNSGDFRIAVLGRYNIGTNTVSADSKYSQIAARLVRGPLRKPNAIAVSAHNGKSQTKNQKKGINDLFPGSLSKIVDSILGKDGDEDTNVIFQDAFKKISSIETPDVVVIGILTNDPQNTKLSKWANYLVSQGQTVICLLEGRYNGGIYQEADVEKISKIVPGTLIDPLPKFEQYTGSASLSWQNNKNIWSPQAHSIVGKLLADEIVRQLNSE